MMLLSTNMLHYQRIIGGDDAPDDTIPWQVLLNTGRGRGGATTYRTHTEEQSGKPFNDHTRERQESEEPGAPQVKVRGA
ncbi:complement C1r-A subcomponent-like protein [Lates japonicus]|uniref:Complement C1r-A subcomponent-like protein n=1 Tax=Lates japonicus TaxID=270547 RepID=A0AAD3N0F3_LATJO|nr:complement C1r-A subcomponent-like protein [Lates japonicus]